MVLLDTNIFIYLVNGTLPAHTIANVEISHASATRIEALGFTEIRAVELGRLEELFNESYEIALGKPIIETAIMLKQGKRMTLGDAMVAAAAIRYGLPLWTANTKDFKHIEGLKLVNPLAAAKK